MIFLTVGTQFSFNRLVKAIDDIVGAGLIDDEIVAQVGQNSYKPQNFTASETLTKEIFDRHFQNATAIISHAGMGTITMAMNNNKPLLVMPRLARFKEVVNDHQLHIARNFAKQGHLLVANNPNELKEKVIQLKTFIPRPRETQVNQVVHRITAFLEKLTTT